MTLLLALFFSASLPARGDVSPTPAHSPEGISPTPAPAHGTLIDKEYRNLADLVTRAVNTFDGFFGDEDLEEEVKKPWIRLRGSVEWQEQQEFVFKERVHYSIPLPVLEDRLQTFFGSDADDDLSDDPDYNDPDEDTDATAGFRYFFKEMKNISTNVSTGIKLSRSPVVYVKPRLKWTYPLPPCYLETTQSVYWYSDDGFGEKTEFEFSWLLSDNLRFKSESGAVWSETSLGMDLEQEFALQLLEASRPEAEHFAVGLEWGTSAHTWTSCRADTHILALRLRRAIWREWLRLEISPRLTWKRMIDDQGKSYWERHVPSLLVTLEVIIGELY